MNMSTLKCDSGIYPARGLLATCIPHNVPDFARGTMQESSSALTEQTTGPVFMSLNGELHTPLQPWSYDISPTLSKQYIGLPPRSHATVQEV